ncbi:MAG: ABC transporter permease [Flavobacteriales bacterium]|jgi:cell division transport system permease protein|nr:ABC transporter permease [Flavobacteriales bacterium]
MAKAEEKFTRKQLRSSYVTVVISIALVLFMLGLLSLTILQAKRLGDYVKENIGFTVMMHGHVKEAEVLKMEKALKASTFIKSTEYIDSERAAAELQAQLGEDFVNFLGYNPLTASIDVRLKAEYTNPDSLKRFEAELLANPKVREIYYQRDLVSLVNENIRRISLVIFVFSALLLVIAIALINNSIRLALYSNRFIIKTMQLVGATSGFIKRPFVLRGILQGMLGAFIALALLTAILWYSRRELPDFFDIQNINLIAAVFGLVLLFGIIISWVSTSLALNRYLRMKTDKLYA